MNQFLILENILDLLSSKCLWRFNNRWQMYLENSHFSLNKSTSKKLWNLQHPILTYLWRLIFQLLHSRAATMNFPNRFFFFFCLCFTFLWEKFSRQLLFKIWNRSTENWEKNDIKPLCFSSVVVRYMAWILSLAHESHQDLYSPFILLLETQPSNGHYIKLKISIIEV